jgi:polyphosphate kinase
LSTGNYNEISARIYTDISLLTCNPEITKDVSELYNLLTGYSKQQEWRKILVAPVNMRKQFKEMINECIKFHSEEKPSSITIVMNSLVDPEMIKMLYCASNKGIPIKLLIRGICCLVPGVEGLSENITVRSIVGRFLEHSRIYLFEYNGEKKIYCGSADWMERNLDRRVEVAFPILDKDNQERILEILDIFFRGNVKARYLKSDGKYYRYDLTKEKPFNAQSKFIELAELQQKYIDTITQSFIN